MLKKIILTIFLLTTLYGQNLTGNLSYDSYMFSKSQVGSEKKKQVMTSAGLSLLVPGAGQLYNKEYWKAAAFIAVEATLIYVNYHYNKKGDDQTTFYHNFANQHWDPLKYARYSLKNAKFINPDIKDEDIPAESDLIVNGKLNWSLMNQFELKLNKWYSHQLPPFGTQQYYELIGKYTQFISGWDDCDVNSFTFESKKTPTSEYYMTERAKANDYYNYATKAVVGILINHVLSAIEAGYSRIIQNNAIKLSLQVQPYDNYGYFNYSTKFNLSYNF